MHDCICVVYQNKKLDGASALLELAATHSRDTGPGAFHSQQQLAERPSCFQQYGAIIIISLQIALKKGRHNFFIQTSLKYPSAYFLL